MFCHTGGIRSDIPRLSTNQHSGLEPPSLWRAFIPWHCWLLVSDGLEGHSRACICFPITHRIIQWTWNSFIHVTMFEMLLKAKDSFKTLLALLNSIKWHRHITLFPQLIRRESTVVSVLSYHSMSSRSTVATLISQVYLHNSIYLVIYMLNCTRLHIDEHGNTWWSRVFS